jgi:hypothetical protein
MVNYFEQSSECLPEGCEEIRAGDDSHGLFIDRVLDWSVDDEALLDRGIDYALQGRRLRLLHNQG